MAKTNTLTPRKPPVIVNIAGANSTVTRVTTHEGAPAVIGSDKDQLLRTVSSCMLFEDTFYETGESIAKRLASLVRTCTPEEVYAVALIARTDLKLRHAPLWLAVNLAARGAASAPWGEQAVAEVVQRPDELGEAIALFFKIKGWPTTAGRRGEKVAGKPIPHALTRGLARAFRKFSAYQLAKYEDKPGDFTLRDVMQIVHPKPRDDEQSALWKSLLDGELKFRDADTWELALMRGADKKGTFTRLIGEDKLGAMATIMNLRKMVEVGVEPPVIRQAIVNIGPKSRLLPMRFVKAAEHAPAYANELGEAMVRAVADFRKLPGRTAVCVDVSASMSATLSGKGTTTRTQAAGALGALIREVCEEARVFVFGTDVAEVQNLRGMALVNEVNDGQSKYRVGHGTDIAKAIKAALATKSDRIIIVTDEQGNTTPTAGTWRGYIVNCAPYAPAIETDGNITRVNGLSERLVDWIAYTESGRTLSLGAGEEDAEPAAIEG